MNSSSQQALLAAAASALERKNPEAALLALAPLLGARPDDIEAQHLKAIALGALGRIDEASSLFTAVAARHPMRHAVLSNFGNALKSAGRTSEAAQRYREAVRLAPSFANGWLNLGLCLYQMGEIDPAEEAFAAAARADPRMAQPWTAIGAIRMDKGQFEEALHCFDRALALRPAHGPTVVQRGRALNALGRTGEAALVLAPAARAPSPDAEAVYQYANVLRSLGRLDEAVAEYRRAVALAPSRIDIHRDLARLRWEKGDGDAFVDDLDAAIARQGDPDLLVLKSEVAFRVSQSEAAESAARRALELKPGNARALSVLARTNAAAGDVAARLYYARAAHHADASDFEIRHVYAEALLAARDFLTAQTLLSGPAPQTHLQKHIGLRCLALRALGDPAYRRWYDYDRLIAQIDIDTPQGYASVAAFNEALAAAIRPLHATASRPIDQTLYGGTQSFGRLWSRSEPEIAAYRSAMLEAARRYVRNLPEDPSHEFLVRKSETLACVGAWSVILRSGGGHVDHIHPAGWISACYYVAAPDETLASNRAGHLRLGGSGVPGLDLPPERYIAPRPGSVVFFPSYMWHGVEPFTANEPRMTAPFDLAPVSSGRP